ncbi:MAG: SDR family NAD(P)-dependent oxidoreductase, partial [candidate division KSB1 bacterium]
MQTNQRGVLDNLFYQTAPRSAPGKGEIELRVHATGLNFRDVLNALGMYPGDPGALGGECAGVVTAVGEGVTQFQIGDEVLALGAGCFSAYVITRADWCAPKPASLNFAEAATIPIPFLTAYYGLHQLAHLKAGERVLIHSAAGGVGVAATQLAQQMGAEIFGTASTGKWEFLKANGVQHVMNSRTLEFAEHVMQRTNGAGVDIVLNSLAEDFIGKSFSVLAPNGRFLEIGKRGVWTKEQAAAARSDVSYWLYYLGEVMLADPALLQTMYRALLAGFESGALKPLPMKIFAHEETVAAFRYMAQAKHAGKVVVLGKIEERGLRIEDRGSKNEDGGSWIVDSEAKSVDRGAHSDLRSTINDQRSSIHNPQSSILLTGAFGGLGLKIAEGLVENGARHLALVGRSAPSDEARAVLAKLEARGAKIFICQADLAQPEDVQRLFAEIATALPRLRGVIHAAGVLDDGVLLQQSWPRFEKVFAPKVAGAWLLHEHTKNLPLDFFVLFSSTSALLGAGGQGNYAAANAFLDGLAHYRRALGLPALSINWGAWAEVGMAAGMTQREQQRLQQQGMGLIGAAQGVEIFRKLLERAEPQIAVLPAQWQKFLPQFGDAMPPVLLEMARANAQPGSRKIENTSAPRQVELLQRLQNASGPQREELLEQNVRAQIARVLGFEASRPMDRQQPLQQMGLDSLMAVELRNALGAMLGTTLPATLLFDYPTLHALVQYLMREALAFEETQPLETKVASKAGPSAEPIAIIGMACRFPGGADTPEALWDLLREGREGIVTVPEDRWSLEEYYSPDPDAPGKIYVRSGGFLREVDKFDPRFFSITPREAASMDPQQRLLLEVAWEALENAAIAPNRLVGSATGVFVGIGGMDYALMQMKNYDPLNIDAYAGTGSAFSVASGRISYTLGLQGPCLAVDTACSSSLVALHLACQSLRSGESEMALACGVNLLLSPVVTINFCKARMLAPDGHCKTFDAAADGYVRGEGCGVVVLKPLSRATADGDTIHAVIRGSAVNHDGRSNGITAPNG